METLTIPGDKACKDAARLFFLPVPRADVAFLFAEGQGEALDVEKLLGYVAAPVAFVMPELDEEEPYTGPVTVDLMELRKRLREVANRKLQMTARHDELEKGRMLTQILNGESVATVGGRDNTLNRAVSTVSFAFAQGTPTEAILEIMRASINAMDCEPEGVQHWIGEVRDMIDRAGGRRAHIQAETDARKAEDKALFDLLMPIEQTSPAVSDADLESDPEAWKALLEVTVRRDGSIVPASSGKNTSIILRYDPRFRGYVKWNEVRRAVEICGGPFLDAPAATLVTAVSNWLDTHYKQRLNPSVIEAQLVLLAYENRYSPVADYLNAITWDNVPRCNSWLEDYANAEIVDIDGRDISRHVQQIGARWMISAVARALDPGCKVDTVLMFEGPQGIGKSSAFEALGGEWFCDTAATLGDKDSRMLATASWIIELPELASLKRSDTETIKAFIATRIDKFRPPFGSVIEEFPRRCVLVGSTNDASYLVDNTGHRRYWPVKVGKCDVEGLKAIRDQLWAEAVVRYRAGEVWWLDETEAQVAADQAEARAVMTGVDVLEARVSEWWLAKAPGARPGFVRADEVAELVLGITVDKITPGILRDVREALKRVGFAYTRRMVDGARRYGYEPSKRIAEAPQVRLNAARLGEVIAARK
jgi:predicted P-loop ATPase